MSHTKGIAKIQMTNDGELVVFADEKDIDAGFCICKMLNHPSAQSVNNAERIVRCWNEHDELVNALQIAIGILRKGSAFEKLDLSTKEGKALWNEYLKDTYKIEQILNRNK